MASRLLHRLRRALGGEGPPATPEAQDFPESSELDDDTAERLSTRLSGTLSFTDTDEEDRTAPGDHGHHDDDDDDDEGRDPLGSGAAATEDGERGAALLTRRLRGLWRRSRGSHVPQRPLFEVTGANVVSEPPSKYVLYTVALRRPGPAERPPAQVSRRYSDFERLHRRLRRQFPGPMAAVSFPRKRLRRNFAAETVARRSRAFERFLGHVQAEAQLRGAAALHDFFLLPELHRAQRFTCTGLYREALGLWHNARQLQAGLGPGPAGPGTPGPGRALLALAGLAVCHQELEEPGRARACCERALRLLGPGARHPLLGPFLEAHVRLSRRLGLDGRPSEARLLALQDAGLVSVPPPSLKELLIKETLD
ncbi:sorting nexin-21 [Tachyglossus aculeatus]|uniref:sorting nexin-21 n=1 Tax=Tachyglossus aculeatus TaxID=9261 RepID=UPI0018F52104|nr:sorting nexin-21 [Tachyglossus aculeatus]